MQSQSWHDDKSNIVEMVERAGLDFPPNSTVKLLLKLGVVGKSIFNIGIGNVSLEVSSLLRHGASAYAACDSSEVVVKKLQNYHAGNPNVTVFEEDGTTLRSIKDNAFDLSYARFVAWALTETDQVKLINTMLRVSRETIIIAEYDNEKLDALQPADFRLWMREFIYTGRSFLKNFGTTYFGSQQLYQFCLYHAREYAARTGIPTLATIYRDERPSGNYVRELESLLTRFLVKAKTYAEQSLEYQKFIKTFQSLDERLIQLREKFNDKLEFIPQGMIYGIITKRPELLDALRSNWNGKE